jgi:putative hydrolase of HD superfamily
MSDDLSARVEFLIETDKLKSVLRRNMPAHLDRQENSAEHSWSLAIMAMLFAHLSNEPVQLGKVLQLVAVHDLVEIHAGDTFCYDTAANEDKLLREQQAADILFGDLPPEASAHFRGLWEEFEESHTAEARFANALDRMLPLLQHRSHDGTLWRANAVTREQVLLRIAPVKDASVALHAYAVNLVEEASRAGWLA